MTLQLRLDIKSELPKAIKWTDACTKQLPFSIAQAITATAKGLRQLPQSKRKNVVADLERLAKRKLDRPKPGISGAFRASTANKRNLRSEVTVKNKPESFNRNRYITGNIEGGARDPMWAAAFRKFGGFLTIQRASVLVPTKNVPRDKYGGPKRAFVKNAVNKAGMTANVPGQVFVGKPAVGSRPLGVYRVKAGNKLEALFIAKDQALYPKPLGNIYNYGRARAKNVFGPYLRQLLKRNVEALTKR
tara:strand:+ start:99 stop:836 length:738 start_codon:yes stop_codon:yes gene_type:complete